MTEPDSPLSTDAAPMDELGGSPGGRDLSKVLADAAPVVRAEANDADRERKFTPAVLELFFAQSLFRLWLPRWLGGDDLDLPRALAVFEEAARVEGSFGWAVAVSSGAGAFAGRLDRAVAEEMFGPRESAVAGSLMVTPATQVSGGFRVSGRWAYASGSQYATWFTANCMLGEGQGTVAYTGQPALHTVAFPRRQVTVVDTWDVLGLRATSSHDFSVQDAFVPADHSFDTGGVPPEPSPMHAFPFLITGGLTIAAVPLGIARHAIDEFNEFAATKEVARGVLRDAPITRIRLAEAELTLRSARELFTSEVEDAWAVVSAGGSLDSHQQALLAACMVHAAQSAARAVDLLFPLAGMAPLYPGSSLGRCWRDVHTATQHALLSPRRLEGAGTGMSKV